MTTRFVTAISFFMVLTFSVPWLTAQAQTDAVDTAQRPARASEPRNKGEAQESTTVKSSKSNSSERLAAPPPAVPAEASNLNLSKSNVNRVSGEQNADDAADADD